MRGKLHDKKGNVISHPKFQYLHNMRMFQSGNGLSFKAEPLQINALQALREHFESSKYPQVQMFSQIDLSKTAFPDQPYKTIAAQLLTYQISHGASPLSAFFVVWALSLINEPARHSLVNQCTDLRQCTSLRVTRSEDHLRYNRSRQPGCSEDSRSPGYDLESQK